MPEIVITADQPRPTTNASTGELLVAGALVILAAVVIAKLLKTG